MAVQEQTPYQEITANGVTTNFDLGFECEDKDHLIVTVDGVEPPVGNWSLTGGAVVFTIAPLNGVTVVIQRDTPLERTTDYQTYNNSFRPSSVNKELDRIWWKLQEIWTQITLLWVALNSKVSSIWLVLNQEIQDRVNGDLSIRAWVMVLLNNIVDSGLVSAIAVTTVESTSDLESIVKWDGRTVYVKEIGMFEVVNDVWVLKPTPAQYVADSTGVSQQAINSQIVIPEMYGAKANDPNFDNTAALNLAFATGKNVYSTPDKTYYVTGSLRTLGQELIGGWKIHSKKATSRKGTWEKEVTVNNDGFDTSNNIRMMYVSSAWDLSEFLAIKALGYNMIHHYVGSSFMGWDWDGSVYDILNNAKSAGLKVSLGIEQDPAAVSDLAAWVNSVDSYPALWAYSVIDEPVSRGFNIAQQDAKIASMRTLTKKPLFTVDWKNNAFEQQYSKNYDFVLVNAYSMKYTAAQSTWLDTDLNFFRLAYGVIKSQVNVRVIPCVSMFTFNPTSNLFSANVDQVTAASEQFSKVGGGDYASFVWDGEADENITGSVRDTQKFQDLSVLISKQPRLQLQTDVIKFGGFNNVQSDWGVAEIIHHVLQKDNNSSDTFIGASAYPITLRSGLTSSDRTEPSFASGNTLSGIAFKNNVGRLVTDIPARKNLRVKMEAVSPTNNISGAFSVYTTVDGGYTSALRFNTAVSGNQVLDYNISLDKSYGTLIFELSDSSNYQYYRNFLRGFIILTDW